jgi:hypothetical protein
MRLWGLHVTGGTPSVSPFVLRLVTAVLLAGGGTTIWRILAHARWEASADPGCRSIGKVFAALHHAEAVAHRVGELMMCSF